MTEVSVLYILQKSLELAGVRSFIPSLAATNTEFVDYGFRKYFYQESFDKDSLLFLSQKIQPQTLYHMKDYFQFVYLFLHIPSNYLKENDVPFLCIGPLLEQLPSEDEIKHIIVKNKFSLHFYEEISNFYHLLPVKKDIVHFERTIIDFASELFETSYTINYFSEYDLIFNKHNEMHDHVLRNPKDITDEIKTHYQLENQMMDAISTGDFLLARDYYHSYSTYYPILQTKHSIGQKQCFLYILNTLCRKAVEIANIHPLYIEECSNKFLVLIDNSNSMQACNNLSNEMIHKYCELVKKNTTYNYSKVIRDMISYINFYYNTDLNLRFFSKMYNINKSYLSSLFKKETGMTLTDYIHHIRMEHAFQLLNTYQQPITAIATACGYNDINHFTRIFKKTYGLSPKKFQTSIFLKIKNEP